MLAELKFLRSDWSVSLTVLKRRRWEYREC